MRSTAWVREINLEDEEPQTIEALLDSLSEADTEPEDFWARMGLKILPESWMDSARCVYGNSEEFGGKVIIQDGEFTMTEYDFYRFVDKLFFADRNDRWASGEETKGLPIAVNECIQCPVQKECLKYAFEERESIDYGIYGGTTPWERRSAMSSRWLNSLSAGQRLALLQKVVEAKKAGVAGESVRLDYLLKYLNREHQKKVQKQISRNRRKNEISKGASDV